MFHHCNGQSPYLHYMFLLQRPGITTQRPPTPSSPRTMHRHLPQMCHTPTTHPSSPYQLHHVPCSSTVALLIFRASAAVSSLFSRRSRHCSRQLAFHNSRKRAFASTYNRLENESFQCAPPSPQRDLTRETHAHLTHKSRKNRDNSILPPWQNRPYRIFSFVPSSCASSSFPSSSISLRILSTSS